MRNTTSGLRRSTVFVLSAAGIAAAAAVATPASAATPASVGRTSAHQNHLAHVDHLAHEQHLAHLAHVDQAHAAHLAHLAHLNHREAVSGGHAAHRAHVYHVTHASHASTQPATPSAFVTAPQGSPRAIAAQIVPASQLWAFDNIISHESGWNVYATNASSGAYGLGQALPASKMASAGPDWRSNPATQIRWALGYMNSRYGSPTAAWAFWQAHNWY